MDGVLTTELGEGVQSGQTGVMTGHPAPVLYRGDLGNARATNRAVFKASFFQKEGA